MLVSTVTPDDGFAVCQIFFSPSARGMAIPNGPAIWKRWNEATEGWDEVLITLALLQLGLPPMVPQITTL